MAPRGWQSHQPGHLPSLLLRSLFRGSPSDPALPCSLPTPVTPMSAQDTATSVLWAVSTRAHVDDRRRSGNGPRPHWWQQCQVTRSLEAHGWPQNRSTPLWRMEPPNCGKGPPGDTGWLERKPAGRRPAGFPRNQHADPQPARLQSPQRSDARPIGTDVLSSKRPGLQAGWRSA